MIDDDLRLSVDALLEAVRARPEELPLAEIVDLSRGPMQVTIERGPESERVYVSPGPDPRFTRLTDRERDVATLVAAGFRNQQIATSLFISLATVKDHVHSILTKIGLESRTEIAAAMYGRLPG
jgi:DNA-binding NarL/FixJ family response regulator